MNIILLISVIMLMTAQNVLKKVYSTKNPYGGTFIFNAMSCLAAAVFFVVTASNKLYFNRDFVCYSVGFAVAFSSAMIFSFLSIREGSLALSSLVISYSLVIPTLSGIILFNEKTTWILWIGIALLCISLALINSGDKNKVKITVKWIIYVFFAFLGNGMCSVVQQMQQKSFSGDYKNEFMIIALLISTLALTAFALLFEKKSVISDLKAGSLMAVSCGIANGAVNLFVMLLVVSMKSSVMFPVISAGGIVATAAISVLVYREKLFIGQYVAMILGVISIVLLNL